MFQSLQWTETETTPKYLKLFALATTPLLPPTLQHFNIEIWTFQPWNLNISTFQPWNLNISTFQHWKWTFQPWIFFNVSTFQPWNFSRFQHFNLETFQDFNISGSGCFCFKVEILTAKVSRLKGWNVETISRLTCWDLGAKFRICSSLYTGPRPKLHQSI